LGLLNPLQSAKQKTPEGTDQRRHTAGELRFDKIMPKGTLLILCEIFLMWQNTAVRLESEYEGKTEEK